jgi:hypothetical protein
VSYRNYLAAGFSVFFLCVSAASAAEEKIGDTKEYTIRQDDLQLTVRVPKNPAPISKATLEITVTNFGSVPVNIHTEGNSIPICEMSLSAANGEVCKMTAIGKGTVGPGAITKYVVGLGTIEPAKSRTWHLQLSDYFQMEAKDYTISYKLRHGGILLDAIPLSLTAG